MSTRLIGVLLFAVASASSLCSDLLIRARGLDHVHGLDAGSYDLVNSVALGIALMMILFGSSR